MGVFGNLGLLWRVNSAAKTAQKEAAMWDWKKGAWKGLVVLLQAAGLLLWGAFLALPQDSVQSFFEKVGAPQGTAIALTALVMAAIRMGGNYRKVTKAGLVVLAVLLSMPARAQDPAPAPADAVVIDVETGLQSVVTRQDRRERASATATLDAPLPAKLRGSLRIVAAGEQDGSSPFELSNPRTFRDVEGCALLRRQLDSGLAIAGAGCVTWSIEGQDGPTDPRMYSALLLVRIPLPGSGYAYVGGGHRGPVGGWAASGTVAYQTGKARLLADYDLPLQRPADGVQLPWVLKTQLAIPLKRWVIR